MASHIPLPRTPLVSSPNTPDRKTSSDSYFGPVTRSITRRSTSRVTSPDPADLSASSSDRSRRRVRDKSMGKTTALAPQVHQNGDANGFLKVPEVSAQRELSRSPSPLGLIPIHSRFRGFIHRHEIPRKVLHVSIGFLVLALYATGSQPSQIHPVLLMLLIPIAASDLVRHRVPFLNRLYVRLLGALMRESEVNGYNGTIWYLAGTWVAMRFMPKDIGVMAILLLSWCDTAASTIGRLWGKHTWRVRRGKSAAGSAAAMVTGVLTAWVFWGYFAPTFGASNGFDTGSNSFAFQGTLGLPSPVRNLLGWDEKTSSVSGALALGTLSVVSGIVASASEAVDLFNWDDNFTIPVLCGLGLWGFLKAFGSA